MSETVGAQPGESRKERADRELGEMLEEIRVALPGVELLLGFLLVLPFSARFDALGPAERGIYLACFVLSATSTALFIAPTAHHRLGFRSVDKEALVRRISRWIVLGLILLAAAVSLATFLVGVVVVGSLWAAALAAAVAAWFILWWFAVPLLDRRRGQRRLQGRQ
jgi:hypothetical protein